MFQRILAALCFTTALAISTPAFALPFDLGARVGLNLANLAGVSTEDTAIHPGLQVAITGQFKTPNSLPVKFIVELMYSQQGAVTNIPGDDIVTNLDYAGAALLGRVYILPPPLRPYVTAGVQAGYAVTRNTVIGDNDPNDLEAINATSAGVTGGAGVRIRQFGVELYAEVRYFRDLINIADVSEAVPQGVEVADDGEPRIFNSVGTISVGVRF
jgi:hypothetical protein